MPTNRELSFTAYCHPEPQGSIRAFVRNGRAALTSDNTQLKPFRHLVTQVALEALRESCAPRPFADKHVPVRLSLTYYFAKPDSARKREYPVVKPDIDKLERATLDALTGVLFHDDAQVVAVKKVKLYGTPERVEITIAV